MDKSSDPRLSLLIEEYKTLREEIGRFQNQQKQSLLTGVGAIALALFGSVLQTGGANFGARPYLLLLLPLILAPIGILYFETEISIFRAGTYLGVNLKKAAKTLLGGNLDGVWDWEDYRATVDKNIDNYNWSKRILFLWPSPVCILAFFTVCGLVRPVMNSVELLGHLLLLFIDLFLITILYGYSSKAGDLSRSLTRALNDVQPPDNPKRVHDSINYPPVSQPPMPNPRIAVLAIHGVGDHQPCEMANAVSDLLEDLKDGPQKPRYRAFEEHKVRMNVAPVKVQGHAFSGAVQENKGHPIPQSETWGPLDALYKSSLPIQRSDQAETYSLDHLFLEGQLADYKGGGPEETYECLRLEGKRYANAPIGREESAFAERGARETDVHVYDMFWSDLSGVNASGFKIFGELYQLLFHLGSVGVNNVKAAAIFFKNTPAEPSWARFDKMQVRAAAMLAWPIPFLNLIILALTLGLFADSALVKLTGLEEFTTTMLVAFAGIAGLIGLGLWRKGTLSLFRLPVAAFLTFASVAAVSAIWAENQWKTFSIPAVREGIEIVATLLVWLAAGVGLQKVIDAYDKRRPGAWPAFWRTLIPFAAFGLIVCVLSPPERQTSFIAMVISLRFIESAFWVLLVAWLIFWFYLIRAFLAGRAAIKATQAANPAEATRARHTNWTARLTIALPAVLFLLLTVAAWAGIIQVSRSLLPHDPSIKSFNCPAWNLRDQPPNNFSALCYRSISASLVKSNALPVSDWAQDALRTAGLGHFPVLLLLVCFAAAITIWAVAPSVLDELSPPQGLDANSPEKSATLGDWLDRGLAFMRWAGRLLYLGILLFPFAILGAMVSAVLPYNPAITAYKAATLPFEQSLGGLVAGGVVTVLGLGGRISKLALGFRPIVRVALDVDNWLREHPRDSNPTAKICGRYVSLLRYIGQWRGADNRGYDALIVFAHSQGTVISADLLRFLHVEAAAAGGYAEYDSTLAAFDTIPIYLFTMGCPLRQLYGLRFPYLYDYAPAGDQDSPLPKPEDLGVDEWVNAYRTGDYVGRFLWRDKPWLPVGAISFNTWDPPAGIPGNIWIDKTHTRVEFSIGPGAHTHYWDQTAAAIAETLDVLIAKA